MRALGGKSLENFAVKKVILSESERKQQICDDAHTAAIHWSPDGDRPAS